MARRLEHLVQPANRAVYHVTTDNRLPYWVYGSQQESGSVATMTAAITAKLLPRLAVPGIFEYGYIAVDPLDPNILYGDWLTRTRQDIASTRRLRPNPFAAASIAMRARSRSSFRRWNRTPVLRRKCAFQNDRCGKQLAGD